MTNEPLPTSASFLLENFLSVYAFASRSCSRLISIDAILIEEIFRAHNTIDLEA